MPIKAEIQIGAARVVVLLASGKGQNPGHQKFTDRTGCGCPMERGEAVDVTEYRHRMVARTNPLSMYETSVRQLLVCTYLS